MRIQETIARKRDGGVLSGEEISGFVRDYTRGDLPDYQASALLMAIYLCGMDEAETATLTGAMAASGQQLDLSCALPPHRPTLDKHSTGGVGDKTSLVVVPILAAGGAFVCKMSGRGLGHTGGTLDKLESIPGFRVDLTPQEMIAAVARVGACLTGQTGDLAPADKKLYALRDTTATVGSLPLIVSSILSKKLAGGAASFLFDVKVGSGALMKTPREARALAQSLVAGARQHHRRAVAVLSDMSQPLGGAVGNALEIVEAVQTLTPGAPFNARFRTLCVSLAAHGLHLAGLESEANAGPRAEELLAGGAALAVFRQIVAAQEGDLAFVDQTEKLPRAPLIVPVAAPQSGFVASIDAAALGEAVVALGGGRARPEDSIDPAVGLVVRASVGDKVKSGAPLVEIHARTQAQIAPATVQILAAYAVGKSPVEAPPLIHEIIYG